MKSTVRRKTPSMKKPGERWIQPAAALFSSLVGILAAACQTGPSQEAIDRQIQKEFPDVPHLAPAVLDEWLSSDRPPPLLLDVRGAEEYAVSHLPNAVWADPDASADQVAPLLDDPEQPIVAYCSVGYRSSRLAERLRAAGYEVSNLDGSIFAWANEGRRLVRTEGSEEIPTDRVHPYDHEWGKLLDQKHWPAEWLDPPQDER